LECLNYTEDVGLFIKKIITSRSGGKVGLLRAVMQRQKAHFAEIGNNDHPTW